MPTAGDLIASIHAAWAGARPPGAGEISLPTYDDEGVAAYFAGKSWEGHTARQLRRLDFAPNVLTAKAFAYYLPAYLIADIEDPAASDTNMERVLHRLIDGRDAIALLDQAQRLALKAYIVFVHDREQGLYEVECSSILGLLAQPPGPRPARAT